MTHDASGPRRRAHDRCPPPPGERGARVRRPGLGRAAGAQRHRMPSSSARQMLALWHLGALAIVVPDPETRSTRAQSAGVIAALRDEEEAMCRPRLRDLRDALLAECAWMASGSRRHPVPRFLGLSGSDGQADDRVFSHWRVDGVTEIERPGSQQRACPDGGRRDHHRRRNAGPACSRRPSCPVQRVDGRDVPRILAPGRDNRRGVPQPISGRRTRGCRLPVGWP